MHTVILAIAAFFLCAPFAIAEPSGPHSTSEPVRAAAPRRVPLGKNVWLEIEGESRRVIVATQVCLNDGALEHLMTRKGQKEHEAILSADIDAAMIHAALLATRAEAGSPVRYTEPPTAPRGTSIKITLEYEKDGKKIRVSAKEWVRDQKTKKPLEKDWVFAGSRFQPPAQRGGKPIYMANVDGDVICVSNFEGAMLDVPFLSSNKNVDRVFEANKEKIPPVGTNVTMILEPDL